MNILENLDSIVYTTENNENQYSGKQIIELAKGNVQYAQILLDRVEWQGIETLIEEDLREGEIVEFNNQYIMTGGIEIEIKEV